MKDLIIRNETTNIQKKFRRSTVLYLSPDVSTKKSNTKMGEGKNSYNNLHRNLYNPVLVFLYFCLHL